MLLIHLIGLASLAVFFGLIWHNRPARRPDYGKGPDQESMRTDCPIVQIRRS